MRINGYEFNSERDAYEVLAALNVGLRQMSHDHFYAAWQFLIAIGEVWKYNDIVSTRAWELIDAGKVYTARRFFERYKNNLNNAETPERRPTREEMREAINDICNFMGYMQRDKS